MRKFFLMLSVFAFTGCGAKTVGPTAKKKSEEVMSCPGRLQLPTEEVTIYLANPPPSRIAVYLDGVLKNSECQGFRGPPPHVEVQRQPGNRLFLKIRRYDKSQVNELSFAVKKLKDDCSDLVEEDFLAENKLPMRYSLNYPDGPNCAPEATARTEIIRQ